MYVQATYVIKKLLKNADNLNKMKEKNKKITWSGKIKKKSDLDKFYRIKINSTKGVFSSAGPIAKTRIERELFGKYQVPWLILCDSLKSLGVGEMHEAC